MSAILLAIIGWDPKGWDQIFRTLAPQRDIRLWPETAGDPAASHYACVWKPPHGMLAEFRNLKAVFSLGAGVDDILADPQLPDVPIVRVVDPDLTMRMTEYVVLHVLTLSSPPADSTTRSSACACGTSTSRRRRARSRSASWASAYSAAPPPSALQRLGFRVAGWSRTQKTIPASRPSTARSGSSRSCAAPRSWSACCRRRRRRAAS